jgi:molybdopterin synthase sulfur carrier subunit
MVKVVFLASIREKLDCEQYQLQLPESPLTVAAVTELLLGQDRRFELLQQERVLVAVNQQMARAESLVDDGDELAFFPPVTGG